MAKRNAEKADNEIEDTGKTLRKIN